jgi:putative addiction module component (TIGR02574 family)
MGKPALDLSKLTAEEKLDLIDDRWRSFSPDDLALNSDLGAELDRRLDRLDREGPNGIAWEDVFAEMTAGESWPGSSSWQKLAPKLWRPSAGTRSSRRSWLPLSPAAERPAVRPRHALRSRSTPRTRLSTHA